MKKWKAFLSIVIMVAILLFGSISLAKSIENVIINSDTGVAEPILIVENNPSIDVTATKNYGVYNFKIRNYNDKQKITDVDLKYYIEIIADTDESVNFILYQDEQKISMDNNKTNYISISKNNKQERNYKIEINYDKTKTESVSDIMQKVQIKVHTEQAKG